MRLRTGPWLSLQRGDALWCPICARIWSWPPERDGSGDGFGDDIDAAAIGLQYRNTTSTPIGAPMPIFGIGRAEEVDTGIGVDYWRVALGASLRPARQTFVRGTLRVRERYRR